MLDVSSFCTKMVEAGDVIVKVNGTDVHRFSTKEVLKCLRLSKDSVTLDLKRDPKIKDRVRKYLAQTSNSLHNNSADIPPFDMNESLQLSPQFSPHRKGMITTATNNTATTDSANKKSSRIPQIVRGQTVPPVSQSGGGGGGGSPQLIKSAPQSPFVSPTKHQQQQQQNNHSYNNAATNGRSSAPFNNGRASSLSPNGTAKTSKARFEAYMMTGDLILNLSRTTQSSEMLDCGQVKKIDSLRESHQQNHQQAKNSRRSLSKIAQRMSGGHAVNELTGGGSFQRAPHARYDSSPSSPTNDSTEIDEEIEHDDDESARNCACVSPNYNSSSGGGGSKCCAAGEKCINYWSSKSSMHGHHGHTNNRDMVDHHPGAQAEARLQINSHSDKSSRLGTMTNNSQNSSTSSGARSGSTTTTHDSRPGSDDSDERLIGGSGGGQPANHQYPQHDYNQKVNSNGHQSKVNCSSTNGTNTSSSSNGGGGADRSSEFMVSDDVCYSVPSSPTTTTPCAPKSSANSVPTSPETGGDAGVVVMRRHPPGGGGGVGNSAMNGMMRTCDPAGFRTSRSEDHLQFGQRDGSGMGMVPIDIDEDVNSSLNTLLDTRHDTDDSPNASSGGQDRIVWTYNAPIKPGQQLQQHQQQQHHMYSHSSSMSSSPQHTDTPVSPTSVSSSVMSSNSSSKSLGSGNYMAQQQQNQQQQLAEQAHRQPQQSHSNQNLGTNTSRTSGGNNAMTDSGNMTTCPDLSMSEAVSNISSPDYQDDNLLLSSRDLAGGMAVSDPSDSDSTLMVSDVAGGGRGGAYDRDNKVVIHVKNNGGQQVGEHVRSAVPQHMMMAGGMQNQGYSELKDSEDELATLTDDNTPTLMMGGGGGGYGQYDRDSSPVSDDGSDVESLHSYHYSPKAVDMPSAIRLAKRLYGLDGFKKSDVSRHLSKNNDFSRAVADEYLKYFKFEQLTLDEALRQFLQQFALSGETQERERVLVHFSKRYLDCNAGTFNSQDAVHTLTCAIMLLNTDLHGQNIGRKMTCSEFIDNLSELNDGENFPRDVLKYLYQAIKQHPLEWALDDDGIDQKSRADGNGNGAASAGAAGTAGTLSSANSLLDSSQTIAAIEYKKGYVMRKCCYDANNKKTPFGKRSWKMFYCTLRDLVLYLHKDEHGFRKNQLSDNVHNAIRIHHALATRANDYMKKQHVFRLQTADQSEYLFQTSDSKELDSWVETINYVCAAFSAPPLEGGVGSQKRYQRPLLPNSRTKLLQKEQLATQEAKIIQLQQEYDDHKQGPVPTKGLALSNYREKEAFLKYELRRYRTYVDVLGARILANGEDSEMVEAMALQQQQQQLQLQPVGKLMTDLDFGAVGGGGGEGRNSPNSDNAAMKADTDALITGSPSSGAAAGLSTGGAKSTGNRSMRTETEDDKKGA